MRVCYFEEDFTYPDSGVHFHLFKTDFAEMHSHDYWEFFIVQSGEIKHTTRKSSQILSAGIGCLIHPQNTHKFVANSHDYQQINVMITDPYFKTLLSIVDPALYDSLCDVDQPIVYEIDNGILNEILKTIQALQTLNNGDKENFVNLVKLIWFDLIKVIYRSTLHNNADYPEWLNEFIIKLRQPENICRPVAELCSLTYFSYSHLSRLFKQYTGETLINYLLTLRLNYGAMLLRTTDTSILSISSALGYDSLSHFSRIFKQHFHLTPKQYKLSFAKPSRHLEDAR